MKNLSYFAFAMFSMFTLSMSVNAAKQCKVDAVSRTNQVIKDEGEDKDFSKQISRMQGTILNEYKED